MKQTILALLMLLMGFTVPAWAQNKIDTLVDYYSATSTSKYTSAVERNPKTRAVVKVVKILELSYVNILPFVDAFKAEANQGDFSERKDGDALIITLACRGTKSNRIYMLKAEDYYQYGGRSNNRTNCNITIIVKYK